MKSLAGHGGNLQSRAWANTTCIAQAAVPTRVSSAQAELLLIAHIDSIIALPTRAVSVSHAEERMQPELIPPEGRAALGR